MTGVFYHMIRIKGMPRGGKILRDAQDDTKGGIDREYDLWYHIF